MEHGKTGRRKRVDRPMREKSAESTVHAEKKVRGKSEKKDVLDVYKRQSVSVPVKSYQASDIMVNDGTAFLLGSVLMVILPLALLLLSLIHIFPFP